MHPVVRKPEPRVLNARHPRAARHLPLLSRRRRRHRRLASCRRLEEKVLVLGLEAGYDLSCVLCDDHTSRCLQLGHTGGRSAGLQCRVAVPGTTSRGTRMPPCRLSIRSKCAALPFGLGFGLDVGVGWG